MQLHTTSCTAHTGALQLLSYLDCRNLVVLIILLLLLLLLLLFDCGFTSQLSASWQNNMGLPNS
jgi:hypothetical protein